MTCPNVRGDITQYCTLNCDHGDLLAERDALAAEVERLTVENQRNSERLNELLGELEAENDRLAAVVAAVHTALDQYDTDRNNWSHDEAAPVFVSAIAKAVRR